VDLQPNANAQDLLDALVAKYPSMKEELLDEQMRLLPHMLMRINGCEIIYLEEKLDYILRINRQTRNLPSRLIKNSTKLYRPVH